LNTANVTPGQDAGLDTGLLRDIHLPEPVSWWPPAPGWWLTTALIIVVFAGAFWLLRQWQRRRWRREALEELARLQQSATSYQQLQQLSALLRRVAMTCFPRQQVASLTGPAWLDFLDSNGGSFKDYAEILLEAPYRADNMTEINGLIRQAEEWIKRVPAERW